MLDPALTVRSLALIALLAGCRLASDGVLASEDDSDASRECESAEDCVLAASSCCACPDFASPDRELGASCDEVECPEPGAACPALEPVCDQGFCTAVCAAVVCELDCAGGFVADDAGCLVCACAEAPPPQDVECGLDQDCVQLPADCCGCARGGQDTAVPADQAEEYSESLMCSDDPDDGTCPEVDVCDPELAARCVAGRCALTADADDGEGDDVTQCGTADLPPCPDGTVCVLNADDESTAEGVGTCQVDTP
jgi:hypothetical protein